MRWDPLARKFLVYNGGGDPPPQTSTTTVNQLYSPEEAARRAQLMAEAQRIYEANKGVVAGAAPGGPSADTQAAQNMLRSFAGSQPYAAMLNQIPQMQTFGMNAAMNPTAAPGFQDTLNTATRKVTEQYMSPTGPFANIRSSFQANNSGGSGTREGIAMGLAGRDYLNTIGDVTGKLTSDAYTKGLDVFSRTEAMAPAALQAFTQGGILPAEIIGGIGQQNEAYDERQRLWQLNAPWQALSPYANIVQGLSNPSTQTTQTTPMGQANPAAPLGMAMMGASLGSMIMPGAGTAVGAGAGLLLSLFS